MAFSFFFIFPFGKSAQRPSHRVCPRNTACVFSNYLVLYKNQFLYIFTTRSIEEDNARHFFHDRQGAVSNYASRAVRVKVSNMFCDVVSECLLIFFLWCVLSFLISFQKGAQRPARKYSPCKTVCVFLNIFVFE